MTAAPLPDARPDNWVDARAPMALRPWLKLGRLDRPAGAWLLLLPGWQGIALACSMQGRAPDLRLMLLFAVGAVVMRSAGCAWNDLVDRDLDRKVARTALRPVASGAISRKGALAFAVGCCLIGLLVLVQLNAATVVLGILSLGLVAAYPLMKRLTWWPQAWLGLTFNWGVLMGFTAVSASDFSVSPLSWLRGTGISLTDTVMMMSGTIAALIVSVKIPALLLYASGIAWTLGYDTIYAVQDLEDDALAGVKSSARRMGASAPRGVAIFYAISAALALAALVSARSGPLAYVALAAFAAHLAWQARRLRVDDPAGALRLFRSNRDVGLILFAACALGAWRPG